LATASRRRGLLKDCFGETPKPTRETRALPGKKIPQQRHSFDSENRFGMELHAMDWKFAVL
jgi:hypothetical protein